MPDDNARKKSGERLAADLRTLREERGLSAEDLREQLRVPGRLFEAFESGRLVEQPLFNRVYLRSLVRGYADATEAPLAPMLSALGATLGGTYEEGQLQREIAAHEAPPEEAPGEADEAASAQGEAEAKASADEEAPESPTEEAPPADHTPDEPAWMTSSPPGASTQEAEQRQREKEERAQQRDREREQRAQHQKQRREERAAQSAAAQEGRAVRDEDRSSQRQRRRSRRGGSNAIRWGGGVLALVAVAVGLYFLIPALGGAGESAPSSAGAADTASGGQPGAQQEPDQRPRADLQIGETMHFTVVAEGGPVRDLKVTRDQDVRRPYWVEQGQATVFPARERIVIQNPPQGEPTLQNVRLLAEGYPYPTDRRDGQGRIVITRDGLQSFADTLRGEPAQIATQRDTAALFD